MRSNRQKRSLVTAVLAFGLLLVCVCNAQAQWTTSGGNTTTTDKVGIGTASPNNPLVVSGGANAYSSVVQNTAAAGTSFGLLVDAGGNSSDYAVRIRQRTGGNELFAVRGDGNVGIGTTSPGVLLDVVGNSSVAQIRAQHGSANASAGMIIDRNASTNTAGLYFQTSASTNWVIGEPAGDLGINSSNFIIATGGGTQRFVIDGSGNVGIGTTSPAVPLEVVGPGNVAGVLVKGGSGTVDAVMGVRSIASGGKQWDFISSGAGSGLTSGSMTLYNRTDNLVGLSILNNGYVGLHTTSPYAPLEVVGAEGSYGTVAKFNRGGSEKPFYIRPLGTSWVTLASAGELGLNVGASDSSQGTQALYINSSGKVGIGTPTPGYKLDVNGDTNVTGNITATGSIAAKYQDVAEWVPASEQLSAGTVVVLDSTKSNQVTSSTVSYDTRVAGVVSEQPGIALGEKSEGKVLVATTGRVRVKVDATKGPIHIGDLLVTSDVPGVAMKSEPLEFAGRKMHMPGTLIGKALEPLEKGKGEILVLLSLQ